MDKNFIFGSLIWAASLVIVAGIIAVGTVTYYGNLAEIAIEAGLCQGTVQGKQGVYWIEREN